MQFRKVFLIAFLIIVLLIPMAEAQEDEAEDLNMIEYGNTEFGTLSSSSAFEAWQFEGYAADLITISLNQVMGELDPYLMLLDPAGRVIATDNDSGDSRPNARIGSLRLPDSGTYTILAQAYRDTTGDYELTLQRDEPGMIYGQAGGGGELPYDVPMIDGISQHSGSDQWTFEGLPGDTIELTMKRLSGTLVPYPILLSPDGDVVAIPGNSSGDTATLSNINLFTAGTYTVVAQRPPGNTTAGDYELRLSRTAEGIVPVEGGGAIEYDETVSAALWFDNPSDDYTFDGTAGAEIQITVHRQDGNLEPTISLIEPDGAAVSLRNNNNDLAIYETTTRLRKNGTYTLTVKRSSSTIGNYDLSLSLISPGVSGEPGGGELADGEAASGAIWAENPVDEYTFEGTPGAQIEIVVVRKSGNFDPLIVLLTPDKASISVRDSDSSAERFAAVAELTRRDPYSIQVQSNSGTGIGDYEITVSVTTPGISQDAGGGAIAYNSPVQAALWSDNPSDTWTFSGESGDAINITVTPENENLRTLLQVFGVDDQLLISSSSNITDYLLPTTGEYTLIVSRDRNAYGDYSLEIEYIRGLVTPPENPVLPIGERIISAISLENPMDSWSFEGQEGDDVIITMNTISGNLDPYLTLMNPDGTFAGSNDDISYNATAALLQITLPVSGSYQLLAQASPKNLTSLGNYALQVIITGTADGRSVAIGGGQILPGETVTGGITGDDQEDVYHLELTEPVTLTIALTRTEGNLNGYLEVLDEAGEVVASDDDSAGGFNPVITGLALEAGQYTIIARRPESDTLSEGVYELTITVEE